MSLWQRCFPNEPHHIDAYRAAVAHYATARSVMLDLGCGDNGTWSDLRSADRGVWGVDVQRHPRLVDEQWFRLMPDAGSIPFPTDTFDLVTARWVLEHVRDPVRFLREVSRVLRPGGVFVAHSIDARHYVARVRKVLNLFPHAAVQCLVRFLYGREPCDTFPTVYRLNTPRQIERGLRESGLCLVTLRRYADPGYFSFSPWTRNAAIVADWALERLSAGRGRIYFTVVVRRPVRTGASIRRGDAASVPDAEGALVRVCPPPLRPAGVTPFD